MNSTYIQRLLYRLGCTAMLVFILTLLPTLTWAEEFKVRRVEIWIQDGIYELDADIDYRFNGTVLEALEHGVPLTLELNIRVRRKGAWFWEKDVMKLQQYRVLRFRALTGLYEVLDRAQEKSQSFATRDAAISYLGEILMPTVVNKKEFEAGEKYLLELRTQLDIESLPLTLRPQAYLDPNWNLSSKWNSWPL